jgi:hypothetical protein
MRRTASGNKGPSLQELVLIIRRWLHKQPLSSPSAFCFQLITYAENYLDTHCMSRVVSPWKSIISRYVNLFCREITTLDSIVITSTVEPMTTMHLKPLHCTCEVVQM